MLHNVVEILGFFFSSRRRHTRLTCDWSSDVCSSDLAAHQRLGAGVCDRGSAGPGLAGVYRTGVSQIVATTMAVNAASRRVPEKAGMKYIRTIYLDWPGPRPGNGYGDVEYRLDRG